MTLSPVRLPPVLLAAVPAGSRAADPPIAPASTEGAAAANGAGLGSETLVPLAAGALVQLDDVFASCGAGDAALAWARVEVRTAGGRVFAYASVIDNATSDPTIVPVIVP